MPIAGGANKLAVHALNKDEEGAEERESWGSVVIISALQYEQYHCLSCHPHAQRVLSLKYRTLRFGQRHEPLYPYPVTLQR